jgi:hypothetical protein
MVGGIVSGVGAGALGTAGVIMLVKKRFSTTTVGAERLNSRTFSEFDLFNHRIFKF